MLKKQLICEDIDWINSASELPLKCRAKIRYRQQDQACEVELLNDESDTSKRYLITFEDSQRAITPGQYLVLYQDEICLGGGVIHSSIDE